MILRYLSDKNFLYFFVSIIAIILVYIFFTMKTEIFLHVKKTDYELSIKLSNKTKD